MGVLALAAVVLSAPSASATASFRFERLAGTDRYDTARVIGENSFPVSAPEVVLARGDNFPDALAGTYVVGGGGAILLTERYRLPAPTRSALERLRTKRVIILGGPAAVDPDVEAEVKSLGITTERLAGSDRYETARLCAKRFDAASIGTVDGKRSALVVSGSNFPDALAGGPLAYAANIPILLTDTETLPAPTKRTLTELGIQRVLVLGGNAAVGDNVVDELEALAITVTRIAGTERTGTATALADFIFDPARKFLVGNVAVTFDDSHVNLTSGSSFADALAGGPHGGEEAVPLLLTNSADELGEPTRAWLARRSERLQDGHIFGGEGAVSKAVEAVATTAARG